MESYSTRNMKCCKTLDTSHCAKVISVEGNVADMDALCEILVEKHGFDPSLPTDWIAEGLFAYLNPVHHLQVLERARHFSGNRIPDLSAHWCIPIVSNMSSISWVSSCHGRNCDPLPTLLRK